MKLRDLRLKRVMSLDNLSKESGISVATLSRLENGKEKPRFVTIHKLAKALNVEPSMIDF